MIYLERLKLGISEVLEEDRPSIATARPETQRMKEEAGVECETASPDVASLISVCRVGLLECERFRIRTPTVKGTASGLLDVESLKRLPLTHQNRRGPNRAWNRRVNNGEKFHPSPSRRTSSSLYN